MQSINAREEEEDDALASSTDEDLDLRGHSQLCRLWGCPLVPSTWLTLGPGLGLGS